MLVVFDIDGTLADNHHRIDYVRTKPKNWDAFDAGIPHDVAVEPIAAVARVMALAGHTVIFCSGRSERSRNVTVDWLYDNNIWQHTEKKLYMRADNDRRDDSIVKVELLQQIIADFGQKPDLWFDDRPRVVRAIRAQGVFVASVYQGEDDF